MIRNRRLMVAGAGAILLLASLVLVAFMMQPSATEILTQALEAMENTAPNTADGHAVVEIELNTPEMSGSATVEIWGRMGQSEEEKPAFRIEVLEVSGGPDGVSEADGAAAVSDGSTLWFWHPSENSVYTGTFEELEPLLMQLMAEKLSDETFEHADKESYADVDMPETAEEAVALLLKYFTAERNGTVEAGDSTAYQVRLVPVPDQMPDEVRAAGGFINVLIGTESSLPLGIEYAEGALGDAKIVATTLELDQGIDDAVFDFQIPEGAAVIQLVDLATLAMAAGEEAAAADVADVEMLTPGYLPAGAKLIDTSQVRGATVQRYALADGDYFTIAQGPAAISYQPEGAGTAVSIRGVSATLFANDDGARTMLTWTEGEQSVWLGGDLAADELTAVAESLR